MKHKILSAVLFSVVMLVGYASGGCELDFDARMAAHSNVSGKLISPSRLP